MHRWRLILHGASDGATNMAVDEALLESAACGAPPTVRLYGWRPSCLSLGYFQPLADADQTACGEAGVTLVRRPTGGRAVLHAAELTYAVVGPADRDPFVGSVLAVYERIASGLRRGLAILGVPAEQAIASPSSVMGRGPACFDSAAAHELVVSGAKIVGSAQTRRAGALLQHGAIVLDGDPARIVDLLALPERERCALRSRLAGRTATLRALLGRQVEWAAAAGAIADGFRAAFELDLAEGELTETERVLAARRRAERYAHPAWLARR